MIDTVIVFLAGLGLGQVGVLAVLSGAIILLLCAAMSAGAIIALRVPDRAQPAPDRPLARPWPAARILAVTGPTMRLACCEAPDYPDGALHCINCSRRRGGGE